MKDLLNIDMYKNGYSKEMFDCIDIPLAAAAGYYNYDYYFYYGMLTAVERNWGSSYLLDFDTIDNVINTRNDNVLKVIGLQMITHLIDKKEDVLDRLKESLQRKVPILLYVQHCSLFYNLYYKDGTGENLHLLIIDGYDPDKNIFRVRDNAFLRGVEILDKDSDIMFPIQLTENMIMDIWNYNTENTVKDYMSQYLNRFFTLESVASSCNLTFQDILKNIIEQITEKKSNLLCFVDDGYKILNDVMKDPEYYILLLIGNMKGMFRALDYFLEHSNCSKFKGAEYEDLKKVYFKCREKHFLAMYKYFFINRRLKDDYMKKFVMEEKENDQMLLAFLNKIYEEGSIDKMEGYEAKELR
ncbi:hypothetical protein QA584_26450 [Anaerocolumna sp. AGMB13025]|uniref:hypothetical protein n=1 Tax=Anaerocolumna sp. AGMB13025 TaxID=3039116 RepID=UPI00241E7007|nr:hypothetical protein [Anaerocolumna sp. AGMB13025]WFR57110.1 hypothetical protein QA584_26450 [Anaerocolumna sp. AGMB13025]